MKTLIDKRFTNIKNKVRYKFLPRMYENQEAMDDLRGYIDEYYSNIISDEEWRSIVVKKLCSPKFGLNERCFRFVMDKIGFESKEIQKYISEGKIIKEEYTRPEKPEDEDEDVKLLQRALRIPEPDFAPDSKENERKVVEYLRILDIAIRMMELEVAMMHEPDDLEGLQAILDDLIDKKEKWLEWSAKLGKKDEYGFTDDEYTQFETTLSTETSGTSASNFDDEENEEKEDESTASIAIATNTAYRKRKKKKKSIEEKWDYKKNNDVYINEKVKFDLEKTSNGDIAFHLPKGIDAVMKPADYRAMEYFINNGRLPITHQKIRVKIKYKMFGVVVRLKKNDVVSISIPPFPFRYKIKSNALLSFLNSKKPVKESVLIEIEEL